MGKICRGSRERKDHNASEEGLVRLSLDEMATWRLRAKEDEGGVERRNKDKKVIRRERQRV